MALTELKGKPLGTQKVVIERGPVRVFAQALLDDDPVYAGEAAPGAADVPVRDAVLGLDGPGRRGRPPDREPARQGPRDPARRAGVHLPRRPVAARRRRARRRRRDLRRVREGTLDGGKLEFYVTETTWKNEQTGEPGRHRRSSRSRSSASPTRPNPSRSRSAMPYSPEQLSDRAEIHDVVVRYGVGDRHQGLGAARHVLHGRRVRRLLVEPGRHRRSRTARCAAGSSTTSPRSW